MRIYIFIVLGIILSITGCATSSSSSPWENGDLGTMVHSATQNGVQVPKPEHYALAFDNMDGYWKHDKSISLHGVNIDTFVPQHESSDKWNERLEITHLNVKSSFSANDYYNQVIKTNLDNMCYYSVPKSYFLRHTPADIIYEYHIANCGKKPNQVVIGRIIRTQNTINNISFALKAAELTQPQQQYMMYIIESAQVM
jgi:hypothetical protein